MSIFPIPYRIQSVNTKFFAISRQDDKPNEVVFTLPGKDSIPEDSVLFSNVPIGNAPAIVEIRGVAPHRLYVSIKEDADKSKLVWSEEKFQWVVNSIGEDKYVIVPADGADLYWFDEFGIGNIIEVRPGKDIKPPQNEWFIMPA